MDISWDDARLFLAIAETGSLSGAARHSKPKRPERRAALLAHELG